MKADDFSVCLNEFRCAPIEDRRAWVQNMFDHGATQNDLAKLLRTSCMTFSRELQILGMRRPVGARSVTAREKWEDYLCDPETDIHREPAHELGEWDSYTSAGKDTSYPLTDADFEGFAEKVVAERKEENPVILTPISGSATYYGTPAQIAETWFKSMPDRKVTVTITWE